MLLGRIGWDSGGDLGCELTLPNNLMGLGFRRWLRTLQFAWSWELEPRYLGTWTPSVRVWRKGGRIIARTSRIPSRTQTSSSISWVLEFRFQVEGTLAK